MQGLEFLHLISRRTCLNAYDRNRMDWNSMLQFLKSLGD